MTASNFSGPIQVIGGGVTSRPVEVLAVPLAALAAPNTDFSFSLPPCRILRFTSRTTLAFTGNTVTLQLGSTAGGVDYVAAATIKAASASVPMTSVAASGAAIEAFAGGLVFGRIAQTATETAVGAGVLHVEFQRTGTGEAAA